MLLTPWLSNIRRGFRTCLCPETARARARRQSPIRLESLEQRCLLSATMFPVDPESLLAAGPLVVDAGTLAGDGRADVFEVSTSGAVTSVSVNGQEVFHGQTSFLSGLVIQGSTDADTLIVNLSAGSLVPQGLFFDGGSSAVGGEDALVVQGVSAVSAGYILDASGGSLTVDGNALAFHGVSSVEDQLAAENRSFQFGPGPNQISLTTVTGTPRTRLEAAGTAISFSAPVKLLALDTRNSAADAIELNGLDLGTSQLNITGDGTDSVTLAGSSSLAGLSIGAGTVAVTGAIDVRGGEVKIVAESALTVASTGEIVSHGGDVRLEAEALLDYGRVDVSSAVAYGGVVHLLGGSVGLFGTAQVDASGATGGGEILIGGDYQGTNALVRNAHRSAVGRQVVLNADATRSGDGGKVIVYATGSTEFAGTIFARGGSISGDGGMAEVSGRETLAFAGFANLGATHGAAGAILFDPKNITIANGGSATLLSNDEYGENPTGDVVFDADLITAITDTGTAVMLQASNDITVNEAIVTNNSAGVGGAVTLRAGRNIFINANITTDDADLTLIANDPLADPNNRDDFPAIADHALIVMAAGTAIDAGTTGDVSITLGTGPGVSPSNDNFAAEIRLRAISTQSGTITVTNDGVDGALAHDVFIDGALSAGAVSVTSAAGSIIVSAAITATGAITLEAVGTNSNLTVNDGATIGGATTAGDIRLAADRAVIVNENVQTTGTGKLIISGNLSSGAPGARNILVGTGAVLEVEDGDLVLDADRAVGRNESYSGIEIVSGTLRSSGSGNISLFGRGGDDLASAAHSGIVLRGDALIESLSTGTIFIDGTGGEGTDGNIGVLLDGPVTTGPSAQVTSVSGNITITGQGGQGTDEANAGVVVRKGAVVTSTDSAEISITGYGGDGSVDNAGVWIDGPDSRVSSVDGAMTITGYGGTTSTSTNDTGVRVDHGGILETTGAATLAITGYGGNGVGGSNGVQVTGNGSTIRSTLTGTGDISFVAYAGNNDSGAGNIGLVVDLGGSIESAATANIAIEAYGNPGGTESIGVLVSGSNSRISATDGDLHISGSGGGNATSTDNFGIQIEAGGVVVSAGTGLLTLEGYGGDGLSGNTGILVTGPGSRVEATDGALSVSGYAGFDGVSYGIDVSNSAILKSAGSGSISVLTDALNLAGEIDGSTNLVVISSDSEGWQVDVGGADGSGVLGIAATELTQITAGTLRVVGSVAGSIVVSANIPSQFQNVELVADSISIASSLTSLTNLSLSTKALDIDAAATVQATGKVKIQAPIFDYEIELGAAVGGPAPGTLKLLDADINRITAAELIIGEGGAVRITVTGAFGPQNVPILTLVAPNIDINADLTVNDELRLLQPGEPNLTLSLDDPARIHWSSTLGLLTIGAADRGGNVTIGTPLELLRNTQIASGRSVHTGTILAGDSLSVDILAGHLYGETDSTIGQVQVTNPAALVTVDISVKEGFGRLTVAPNNASQVVTTVHGGDSFDVLVVDFTGLTQPTITGSVLTGGTVTGDAGGELRSLDFEDIEQLNSINGPFNAVPSASIHGQTLLDQFGLGLETSGPATTVTVQLFAAADLGTPLQETTSDPNGDFVFSNLAVGDYVVRAKPQADQLHTFVNNGQYGAQDYAVFLNDGDAAIGYQFATFVAQPGNQIVTWDGEAGDGLWGSAANWSGDVLPDSTSDVFIDDATAIAIDVDASIHSLHAQGDVVLNAGHTLSLAYYSEVGGNFSTTGDATLSLAGAEALARLHGTDLVGLNVFASNGANLELTVRSYSGSTTATSTTLESDDATVTIILVGNSFVAGNTAANSALHLTALQGGTLTIGNTPITLATGNVQILSDGVGSLVDLAANALHSNTGGATSLTAQFGGRVNLTSTITSALSNMDVFVRAGSELSGELTLGPSVSLRGTGTLSGPVDFATPATGVSIAPGGVPGSAGPLTFEYHVTLNSDVTFDVDLTSTGNDQLVVFGNVNVTGAVLKLHPGAGLAAGSQFMLVDNDGYTDAVTGQFQYLGSGGTLVTLNEGDRFSANGYVFRITYQGGDSNDIVLTLNSAPTVEDYTVVSDVYEDTSFLIDVSALLASANDVDGDPLQVSIVSQPVSGGSVILVSSGTQLQYLSGKDSSGPDSFTFTVSDGQGGSTTATVYLTVNPVNDPPIVADYYVNTVILEDSAGVTINVSALLAGATDAEDDLLQFGTVSQAPGGTVTLINSDSQLHYQPWPDFAGEDSFTFTITDGQGGETTATVHLTVTGVNDPPTLNPISDVTFGTGPKTVQLYGLSPGPYNERDPINVSVSFSSNVISLASFVAGYEGTGLLTFNAPDSLPQETPVTVTVTVDDGAGGSIQRSFVITIPRGAPDVGDTLGTATPVYLDPLFTASVPGAPSQYTQTGTIDSSRDTDVYVFTAPRTGLVQVEQLSPYIDSFLAIYDADRRLLTYSDNSGVGTNSLLRFVALAGQTYYIRTSAVGTATGSYNLRITVITDEIDDDAAGAFDISRLVRLGRAAGALDEHGGHQGIIDTAGDVDYVKFQATQTGLMTVTQNLSSTLGQTTLDSILAVFGPVDGNPVGFLTGNDDFDDSRISRVTFDVVDGQTYYIRVSGFGSTAGIWGLDFRIDPADAEGELAANARPLTTQVMATGESAFVATTLERIGDVDYFKYVPQVSGHAAVLLTSPDNLQLVLDAFNASYRVAHDHDASGGVLVEFDVVAGQTYYLRVASSIPGQPATGRYELLLNTQIAAPTTPPGPTLTAAQERFFYDVVTEAFIQESTRGGQTREQIAQAINTLIVNAFITSMGGLENLQSSYFLAWFDPVDFVQTGSTGRQAGYTQAEGSINEYGPHTSYSGNGATELLIIPNATASIYNMQLIGVGSGSFLAGFNYIGPAQVQSVTIAETLFKGSTSLVLDFSGRSVSPTSPGTSVTSAFEFNPAAIAANITTLPGQGVGGSLSGSAIALFTALVSSGIGVSGNGRTTLGTEGDFFGDGSDPSKSGTARARSVIASVFGIDVSPGVRTVLNGLLGRSSGAISLLGTAGRRLLRTPPLSLEVLESLLDDLFKVLRDTPVPPQAQPNVPPAEARAPAEAEAPPAAEAENESGAGEEAEPSAESVPAAQE